MYYRNFIAMHGVVSNHQFEEVAKVLRNKNKLTRICSLPENKLYEISTHDEERDLIYAVKENILHIMPAMKKRSDIRIVIKNFHSSEIDNIATFLSGNDIIENINSIIALDRDNQMVFSRNLKSKSNSFKIYGYIENDFAVISCCGKNDVDAHEASFNKKYYSY